MADFTITISNSLNVIGIETPNLWNTMEWGENWGYGDVDLPVVVDKVIAESLSGITDAVTTAADFVDSYANSLSLSSAIADLFLVDADGYFHVFRGGVTDGIDRISTDYTSSADPSTSWTPATDPTTSWS